MYGEKTADNEGYLVNNISVSISKDLIFAVLRFIRLLEISPVVILKAKEITKVKLIPTATESLSSWCKH